MTKADYLQKVVERYIDEKNPWPASMKVVAKWAIARNLWSPPPQLTETRCAEELSDALRDEYAYDPQGRKIRTKHAAIDPAHPEQGVLWADIRTAPELHMQRSFDMRRNQIIGDCTQLKLDVDSYNENRTPVNPIQMSFDFTDELKYPKYEASENNHYRTATH